MAVTTWSFTSSVEGWTIRDESTPANGSKNTLAYDSGNQALEQNAFVPAIAGSLSRGWLLSPYLGAAVAPGDTIAMDVNALTGAPLGNTTRRVKAVYTDATTEEQTAVGQGAVTVTLNIAVTKTLDHIELVGVEVGNGAAATSYDLFCDVTEVRLTTATAFNPLGQRPIGVDIELEFGTTLYTTYWDGDLGGDFMLKVFDSDLTLLNTYTIANSTVTYLDLINRTYFLMPYCPPFFGTASLEDIVYIYGRWNDGAVKHLAKSTNGGSSFSDIGDSATWGVGWVGGFLADDANTLYAFVNGASRALYRSLNGGTSWSSLSSLPFDVDPGAVSKHPDGRILIANRAAESQMVAYADSAYSSWTNATGSPSFPTTGGGARSIVWVV
jgi:hypothetical protein